VIGTLLYHTFLPTSNTTLIAKKYSKVQDGSAVAMAESISHNQTIPFETVRGLIAAVYEDHWRSGLVLEKHDENEEFKMRFLHAHGPSPSSVFPSQPDELILPVSLILSMVTPTYETGRTYKLSSAEAYPISKLLEDFKMM
jgi:hypothetical protein